MIFFFTNVWPKDFSRGITKKIFAQMRAMDSTGHPVKYFTGYTQDGAAVYDRKGNIVFEKRIPCKNPAIKRIIRNYVLKSTARIFLREKDPDIDIVYIRYLYFDPLSISLFRVAKKYKRKTILELHSYPIYYARSWYLYPIYAVDFLCRHFILKNTDRIVAISDRKTIWGRTAISIDNGIDLDRTVKHKRVKESKEVIRLVSVSYEWYAHGYDRVVRGICDYYIKTVNPIRVEAVFVGTVTRSTRELIKKLNVSDYIKITGLLSGEHLEEVYNHCDIGIGPLAVHRVNTIGSGLKTKEYIAKGMPFIYAGNPMFDESEFPYGLRIEADESPLDISKVILFYRRMKAMEHVEDNMRSWAKDYTWEKEMQKVFLNDI